MKLEDVFEAAPGYGTGIFRRRIRLTGRPGQVFGELEDDAHAMRCRIDHDGRVVSGIAAEFRRAPMDTCAGADVPLAELSGVPLGAAIRLFFGDGRARRNCTHMLDLAWLAITHATRGETIRDYEGTLPDAVAGASHAVLKRDGQVVLEWSIQDDVVCAPSLFAGRALFAGFIGWALANFEGDELEAVLVLQKVCFVAQSRRSLFVSGPLSAAEKAFNIGGCHSYGAAQIGAARRLDGTRRDFTTCPDKLLKFL